jgi:hypothetical protein
MSGAQEVCPLTPGTLVDESPEDNASSISEEIPKPQSLKMWISAMQEIVAGYTDEEIQAATVKTIRKMLEERFGSKLGVEDIDAWKTATVEKVNARISGAHQNDDSEAGTDLDDTMQENSDGEEEGSDDSDILETPDLPEVLEQTDEWRRNYNRIVWAQTPGFPWWPCMIYNPSRTSGKVRKQALASLQAKVKKHVIYYYQSKNYGFASPKQLKGMDDFLALKDEMMMQKQVKSKRYETVFQQAVNLALGELNLPPAKRCAFNHKLIEVKKKPVKKKPGPKGKEASIKRGPGRPRLKCKGDENGATAGKKASGRKQAPAKFEGWGDEDEELDEPADEMADEPSDAESDVNFKQDDDDDDDDFDEDNVDGDVNWGKKSKKMKKAEADWQLLCASRDAAARAEGESANALLKAQHAEAAARKRKLSQVEGGEANKKRTTATGPRKAISVKKKQEMMEAAAKAKANEAKARNERLSSETRDGRASRLTKLLQQQSSFPDKAVRLMQKLEEMNLNLDELRVSGAAGAVNSLRKHENASVSDFAKGLRARWKKSAEVAAAAAAAAASATPIAAPSVPAASTDHMHGQEGKQRQHAEGDTSKAAPVAGGNAGLKDPSAGPGPVRVGSGANAGNSEATAGVTLSTTVATGSTVEATGGTDLGPDSSGVSATQSAKLAAVRARSVERLNHVFESMPAVARIEEAAHSLYLAECAGRWDWGKVEVYQEAITCCVVAFHRENNAPLKARLLACDPSLSLVNLVLKARKVDTRDVHVPPLQV